MTNRDDELPESGVASEPQPKTAVILIHGMGEQRPMGSLFEFVETVWSRDSTLVEPHNGQVYSKLSGLNALLDLRRVTTRNWSGEPPRRVDFFEYYWAHLMVGNTIRSTTSWIFGLFIRRPSSVPTGLRSIWLAGAVLLVLAACLLLVSVIPASISGLFLGREEIAMLGGLSALAGLFATRWLAPVAGDAARYFSPVPDNVTARENIIRGGVELVERLTRSGEYDRIIVVGHSLGSAIGLDILNMAFGKISAQHWSQAFGASAHARGMLKRLEKWALQAVEELPADEDQAETKSFVLDRYREDQRGLADALASDWAKGTAPWLVSDFVTLGSPLSKAHVLIARNEDDFSKRQKKRQVPTCPPMLEQKRPPRFSYRAPDGTLVPHQGAVFAPTVWTNIYFPSRLLIFGDVISGAVAPLFGKGVRDVRMPSAGLAFRHLDYWRLPAGHTPVWIRALRHALNLRKRTDAELWRDGLPTLAGPVAGHPSPKSATEEDS